MNIPNLVRLKEVLLDVIAQGRDFDLKRWGVHPNNGHEPAADNLCGFTACAVGYGCMDPVLQSRGLGHKWDVDHWNSHNVLMVPVFSTGFGYSEGFDAVASFFEIEDKAASSLFAAENYEEDNSTPQEVIARIDYLLAYGEEDLIDRFPDLDDEDSRDQ